MTVKTAIPASRSSILHGVLSLIVPGLGQFIAGARSRGLTIFFSTLILGSLSVWTIAQEARFPDLSLSLGIYVRLVLECGALLLALFGLRNMSSRSLFKDPAANTLSLYAVATIFFAAVLLAGDALLATAGSPKDLAQIYTGTALYSAAALALLWIWQMGDAARIGALQPGEKLPSFVTAFVVMCVLVFSLGYNITGINAAKAIREYEDVSRILPQVLWPWKNAFEYDQEVVEETQAIQAPCPAGEVGPPSNPSDPNEPWISATPTCGEIGTRDLNGGFVPGTELTITGGNFTPGQIVHILWKNPIGNAFTPRGVGPTDIEIDENGEFTTKLNIPDVAISESTAVGPLIHTLVVREESREVFSGRLSAAMKQALVGILVTIMIALMATFFGILLAFPLSFLAARNLMGNIYTPLDRLVGSLTGLVLGFWAGLILCQKVADALGGLDNAPIQIFLAGVVLITIFGAIGAQLGARLFGLILGSLGKGGSRLLSAAVLAALAALPGFVVGLGYSRGIRAIVMGADMAAVDEVLYGYIGAGLAVALALAYGLLNRNPRGVPIGSVIYIVTRTILNVVRALEPIVYAIVAVVWVGLGPFAGTIALTIHTITSLAKQYSEAIESIDPGPLEALVATGASRLQTVVYAVVPQVLPPYIAFTLYRWDINVRMSTIIGLVGGGGLGFYFIQWQRLSLWENVGLAAWLIAITVIALDFLSAKIRERYV